MKKQGGFTVLEMITAAATILILSGIAAPVMSTMLNRFEFTGTVEQLAYEIARARMQAVAQNTNMRVRLTSGGYVREKSSDGTNWTVADSTIDLPSGLTATAGTTGTPRFGSNGLATASTDITVQQGTRTKTIHTNIVGRVTIS